MAQLKSILRTLINPLKLLLQSKAERRHELVGPATDEKWQGFPVVYRSLDFYIEAGFKNGLRVSDPGTLKSFGHITGIETQDIQRMLRITKIIPTTTVN
ncbi:MAG: hypothetical protein Q8K18_09800 [Burkholderiales bacterium]|nr:hypothetical protein [Burkholderiales bacterium]